MANILDKVLLGDTVFTTEMEKLIAAIESGGGGSGEPSQYVKNASFDESTRILTLTKKDGSTVTCNLGNYISDADFNAILAKIK